MRLAGIVLALALPAVATEIPQAERRSGYDSMRPETRAMQDDDAANPAMLWVMEGQALWSAKPGPDARACALCHLPTGAGHLEYGGRVVQNRVDSR